MKEPSSELIYKLTWIIRVYMLLRRVLRSYSLFEGWTKVRLQLIDLMKPGNGTAGCSSNPLLYFL